MPLDLTDDKSTLVQVMAWCRQATSQYLNQCWPRSPTPYGVTRPQGVKYLSYGPQLYIFSSQWRFNVHEQNYHHGRIIKFKCIIKSTRWRFVFVNQILLTISLYYSHKVHDEHMVISAGYYRFRATFKRSSSWYLSDLYTCISTLDLLLIIV